MAGMIESVIKTSPLGRWYIELTDTMKEDEESIVCLDVFEYADKVEEMSKEYDGVVEVMWSSDDGVTPEQINEVRMQMNAYEAEQEAKKNGEANMPDCTPNFDGTPDFSA